MIEITESQVVFQRDDGVSVFPIPFPFSDNSHIEAFLLDADGLPTKLSAGTDYTVTNIDDNGELVLLGEELASECTLLVRRRIPLTQEVFFHNQGPNSPKAVEESLDKLTMIAQQQQDQIDRRLEAPEGSTPGEMVEMILASVLSMAEARQALEAMNDAIDNKSDVGHAHDQSEITGLREMIAEAEQAYPTAVQAMETANAAKESVKGKVDDAPNDGTPYVRNNASWNRLADSFPNKGPVRVLGTDGSNTVRFLAGQELPGNVLPYATAQQAGVMTKEYAAKLDGIFPTGPQTFFVDPAGDSSSITPGTADKPFKSLRVCYDAILSRQLPSPHPVVVNINPGTYPQENLVLSGQAPSSNNWTIKATDTNNWPKLRSASFSIQGEHQLWVQNIDLTVEGEIASQKSSSLYFTGGNKIMQARTNKELFRAMYRGQIVIYGSMNIDFVNSPALSLFYAFNYGEISLSPSARITLVNIPSFDRTAVADDYGKVKVEPGATLSYSPSITGQRYGAYFFGCVRLNGAGEYFFPGTTAGVAQAVTNALVTY